MLLFGIFVTGFALRVINLSSNLPGLYNDELDFLLSAYAQLHHIEYLTIPSYNLTDFIFYSINGYIPSIILFHHGVFSARFPVAIYGSLMVFPIYLISVEIFKEKRIGLLSSFLWVISPSAVVTSRVGYGIEIFPLFLFLFFLNFWILFIRKHSVKYLLASLSFAVPILFFSTLRTWAFIPLIATVIFTLLFFFIINVHRKHFVETDLIAFCIALFVAIFAIWFGLLYAPIVFAKFGITELTAGIPSRLLLVSRPFPNSLATFFLRLAYALAPWKMFWLSEFTPRGLNYGSPVFVPSMPVVLIPFFYATVFIFPLVLKKNREKMHVYYLLIALMLFGLLQPVFNITNPYYNFEPSEGIFSLPFYSILCSFSFFVFIRWSYKNLRGHFDIATSVHSEFTVEKMLKQFHRKKAISALLIAAVVVFAGVNVASFSGNLFVTSPAYYQDNNKSTNYMFYGWDHVSNYLMNNNIYNETIYYTPGMEGNYNMTNAANFHFWFYHQNFPLYWLYTYSGGKINSVHPIYSGSLPPVPRSKEIVLSQNVSYTNLLSENGFNYSVLHTIYRADGRPAIEIIQISDSLNTSQKLQINRALIFEKSNVSHYESFNVPALRNLSDQITVMVKFSFRNGLPQSQAGYNLIKSVTPTFSLAVWPANIFFHGASNTSFVPIGAIYTNFGCYSQPYTWQRLYGYQMISADVNYTLAMTFDNGIMWLYLNGTIIGEFVLHYPLYPPSSYLLLDSITSNTSTDISFASVWNTALSPSEVGFLSHNIIPVKQ